ncbi:hypothetical protein PLICRDRAFT_170067 [Plicaturopsis crispa FD-325 SS-3]|nr:hypothetical protein PLICRDRAFT_170067 [Plicaturopsis crispa FD-325 SS-3]
MVWPRKPAVSPNLTDIPNTPDDACAHTSEVLRIWGISDIKPDGEYFTVATSARYQQATLIGPSGERTPVLALVDGGASRNVIDKACFERIAARLAPLKPGTNLKSAGDFELRAFGAWEGYIDTAGVAKWMQCEVIDLKGAVDMILGRPWLRDTRAQHDYEADTITVSDTNRTATLYAQHRESVLRKRREEGLPTIPEGDEPHDNPEQATTVLPHRPSEDLPAAVPTEMGQRQSCSGCADEGYCVPDPSRLGPRSTNVDYVDVAPPTNRKRQVPAAYLTPSSTTPTSARAHVHLAPAHRALPGPAPTEPPRIPTSALPHAHRWPTPTSLAHPRTYLHPHLLHHPRAPGIAKGDTARVGPQSQRPLQGPTTTTARPTTRDEQRRVSYLTPSSTTPTSARAHVHLAPAHRALPGPAPTEPPRIPTSALPHAHRWPTPTSLAHPRTYLHPHLLHHPRAPGIAKGDTARVGPQSQRPLQGPTTTTARPTTRDEQRRVRWTAENDEHNARRSMFSTSPPALPIEEGGRGSQRASRGRAASIAGTGSERRGDGQRRATWTAENDERNARRSTSSTSSLAHDEENGGLQARCSTRSLRVQSADDTGRVPAESGGHDALPLDASTLVPAQRDQHRKVTEASQPPLAVPPARAVSPPHRPRSPSPACALLHALAVPLSPHAVSVW